MSLLLLLKEKSEAPPVGDDLLLNGDFEDWGGAVPDHWEKVGTETIAKETVDVHSGSNAVRGTTTGPICGVRQVVSAIPASTLCHFSFWQHVDATAALPANMWRVGAEVEVVGGTYSGRFLNFTTGEWEEESPATEKHLPFYARPLADRYVQAAHEFVTPPEEVGLRITLKRIDGEAFTFHIDSASLKVVPRPTRPTSIDWGQYQPKVPDNPAILDEFIHTYSRPDYIGMYREWGGNILTPNDIEVLGKRKITPMISWEPVEATKEPTPAEIASGAQDAYIDSQAELLKAYGEPVILRPYWEMNINTLLGAQMDPNDYVDAWRHMHDRFAAKGVTNVKWFWCPSIDYDRGEGAFEGYHDFFPYFPGDEYVDYVGADGYSSAFYDSVKKEAGWATVEEIFSYTYRCMMALSDRPFIIGETGVEEKGGDKAEWITTGLLKTIPDLFPRIEAVVYFNRHNPGEPEWELNTSTASERAFRRAVRSHLYSNFPRVAITREFPPDRYAVRVSDRRTGRTIARLAEDEGELENILGDASHSSEMQGGSKEFKGRLARDPRNPFSDLPLYADLTVYVDGVDEVWWGRIDSLQGAEGDRTGLDVGGVGHIAALEDDKAVLGLGFIDSDQSKWGDPTTERRKRLIEANVHLTASTSFGFGSLEDEHEPPAILNDFTSVTAEAGKSEAGEADYDSGGVDIGDVLYDYRVLAVPDSSFDTNIALGRESTFSDSPVAGPDHSGTTALQQQVPAGAEGYRYARLRDLHGGSYEGAMTNLFAWQNLRVLGNHGLALQGTWPNVGYTAKQMLGYAVPRYSYLEARDEDLEDDGFVIPHAWFSEPGMLVEVVKELTKYGLLDWFIYQGKRLQLKRPGTYGRFWHAEPGLSESPASGLDANRLWREIVVAFQAVDGRTIFVGPPGSGAHVTDENLRITDPDHPAVRADMVRKDIVVMKGHGDIPTAKRIGVNWLEDANELSHAGTATFTGWVMNDKGIYFPTSVLKAGDHVRPVGQDSYRKVTAADYQRSEKKAYCHLDAPPDGLAALEERYQVELRSWGISA